MIITIEITIIVVIVLFFVNLYKPKKVKHKRIMYNCFDIAKYLIDLGEKEGVGIDTMKLLKLTYISQGYYLAFFDKALFSNQIQAWKYGPVIPELYYVIKPFGHNYVNSKIIGLHTENEISKEDGKFLTSLWGAYKKSSGIRLSELTHQEDTPWAKTFKPNMSNISISNSIIMEYYKAKITKRREELESQKVS